MSLLSAPDPTWPAQAQAEAERWRKAELQGLITIHHIGSTSVPGLPAKPIIDLLPVFEQPDACDNARHHIEALGYEGMGALGLPGRRYVRRDDPQTGKRLVQAHCFATGSPEITRHLAFRDALRQNAALRAAYTSVKARCAALHPGDHRAYGACKSGWIDKTERTALERQT
ncbi:GrpB family protein [Ruegeria jejuensis]|uniref:GrpB family protein n=1 Tax=Ruegeria jejuensis TaxID=3233338 RepID=UPI00355ADC1F